MKFVLIGVHPKEYSEPFHPKTYSGRILRKIIAGKEDLFATSGQSPIGG